VVINIKY